MTTFQQRVILSIAALIIIIIIVLFKNDPDIVRKASRLDFSNSIHKPHHQEFVQVKLFFIFFLLKSNFKLFWNFQNLFQKKKHVIKQHKEVVLETTTKKYVEIVTEPPQTKVWLLIKNF